jgi:2,3-bisphosphoglycerate-independent phosphoglycerate mutase
MKAREVCDVVIADLRSSGHRFLRANFANGDMVGHTGSLPAAITAVEVVDECVGRILEAVRGAGATLLVTADHGNSDMMWEVDRKSGEVKLDGQGRPMIKTSHTLSPVPLWLVGAGVDDLIVNPAVAEPGLGNIAATILFLLGFQPPASYLPTLVVPGK